MCKNFCGLRENPFNVNPDPRFLYLTPQTQEALAELTYGIQNRRGLILLTGEVGTGKTTLINCLLDRLRHQKIPTAFIFNCHLSVNHLFEFILTDFGIPIDIQLKSSMLMRLNTWLIECFRAGESPVLIVDEAQGLSFESLEEIRLLLNLETASEKLLQIVLAGQPELEDKLKRPELRQLRQRITLRCNTKPLTLEESHGYITERLRIGGAIGDTIFASDAMDAVHFYSQGIPRVINLLCEHALINAYAKHSRPVPARMVEEAAHELFLDEGRQSAKEEANLQEPSHVTSLAGLTAFDAVYTINQLPRSSRRTVIHALLLSWKSWSSRWVTGFLHTVSLAEWSHRSLVALRRIRQLAFLGQALLRRWKCDFKRDWIAMINAMH